MQGRLNAITEMATLISADITCFLGRCSDNTLAVQLLISLS